MIDPRFSKLAEMMVNYSLQVQPGWKVLVTGYAAARPLFVELFKELVKAGAHPSIQVVFPETEEYYYKYANDEQLKFISEPTRYMIEEYEGRIVLLGDENSKYLSNVNPERIALSKVARKGLFTRMLQRMADGSLKYSLTLFPTDAHAMNASMSLTEYTEFFFNAAMPDPVDPVGYWKRFSAKQQRYVDYMNGKEKIHIRGKDTDLVLSVAGRNFINSDGRENVPDGEIFTSPIESSANGTVYFSYPTLYEGREVTGVRLWFEDGRVVKASAEKNEEYLLKTLATDSGSSYLGEFAIGTNEGISQFTGEILFDEKIDGSFHLALGGGFPECGGKNESGIHWDMICDLRDGGEIRADDELIYQNGRFIID